jgi:hypothetical protein
MNKRCGGDKTDRQAFLACRQPEAEGNVGFAGAGTRSPLPKAARYLMWPKR